MSDKVEKLKEDRDWNWFRAQTLQRPIPHGSQVSLDAIRSLPELFETTVVALAQVGLVPGITDPVGRAVLRVLAPDRALVVWFDDEEGRLVHAPTNRQSVKPTGPSFPVPGVWYDRIEGRWVGEYFPDENRFRSGSLALAAALVSILG